MKATLGNVLGRIPKPSPAMAMALLALVLAASGAAFAAGSVTGPDGTITACRDSRGAIRVIDAANQTCGSRETKLTWKDGITGQVNDSDLLDGKNSSDFAAKAEAPGADATHVETSTLPNDTSRKKVGSVTLTAPADGFVIVTASGNFQVFNKSDRNSSFELALGHDGVVDFDPSASWFWTLQAGLPIDSVHQYPFSFTKMYPVTAGNQTFSLWGGVNDSTTDPQQRDIAEVNRANITAIYVKNRY